MRADLVKCYWGFFLGVGLAASSSVMGPILSPVSAKLKSGSTLVGKPQEGAFECCHTSCSLKSICVR